MDDKYYKELAKLPTLSEEDILKEFSKYHQGDEAALNRIVEANLRLVVFYAKQYEKVIKSNEVLELGDLISAGNLGLIQAAKKFDISIGAKFSSYGGYWIRMEIMKLLNTHMENIKIPIHKQKEGFKIHVERIFQDIEFTSEVEEQDDSYEERIAQVMNALNKLPLKQQKVIKEYFGIGCDRKSLVNIGIENAQMKQAVWDTKDRALKNLKGQLGNRTFHN